MRTPTKEKLAEKLAASVYEDIAGPLTRAKDFGARLFRGLRITPTMTVDPEDGSLSFSFAAGHQPEDVDATLERLFELVAAGRRRPRAPRAADPRRVPGGHRPRPRPAEAPALGLPGPARGRARLPRQQAAHDGAHLQRREASRSGAAPRRSSSARSRPRRSASSSPSASPPPAGGSPRRSSTAILAIDGRPPLRDPGALLLPLGGDAGPAGGDAPSGWTSPCEGPALRARALQPALGPGRQRAEGGAAGAGPRARAPASQDYGRRHRLPSASSTQKALEALERDELVGRDHGRAWIAEPFLAEWIRAEAE